MLPYTHRKSWSSQYDGAWRWWVVTTPSLIYRLHSSLSLPSPIRACVMGVCAHTFFRIYDICIKTVLLPWNSICDAVCRGCWFTHVGWKFWRRPEQNPRACIYYTHCNLHDFDTSGLYSICDVYADEWLLIRLSVVQIDRITLGGDSLECRVWVSSVYYTIYSIYAMSNVSNIGWWGFEGQSSACLHDWLHESWRKYLIVWYVGLIRKCYLHCKIVCIFSA